MCKVRTAYAFTISKNLSLCTRGKTVPANPNCFFSFGLRSVWFKHVCILIHQNVKSNTHSHKMYKCVDLWDGVWQQYHKP